MIARPHGSSWSRRTLRQVLIAMVLACLVLPAMALRDCPMFGLTSAAACCCCQGEDTPPGDALQRPDCCESAPMAMDAPAVTESASTPVSTSALPPPPTLLVLAPVQARARVRGARGPPPSGPPTYLRHRSLLL